MPDADPATKASAAPELGLADFIRQEMDAVIAEWVEFARSHVPSGANMTRLALQDHIVEILTFVAKDLESPQSAAQQVAKSKGDGPLHPALHRSAAEMHASLRLRDGFDIDQMVSEYRALRASVMKQWVAHKPPLAEHDINDLTRFNEAIDQAIAESVAEYTRLINESRNLFLGILGHDLRNPIGAASMAGEMLRRLAAPDTKQMTLASNIVDATQRGIQILDDLLDITRSAFGADIPVARTPMEMGGLAVKLVEETRPLAKGRAINLDIIGDTAGAWDKARMGQVFSNLLGNAIAYGAADSAISVTVEGKAREVAIAVHNHGEPIAADKLATIFEALTRGQPARVHSESAGHLGLGLFIARKIVVAHGGSMDVVSGDAGTTFTARVPRG